MRVPQAKQTAQGRLLKESPGWSADVERAFRAICMLAMLLPLLLLVILIGKALADGWPRLNWTFLSGYPSRKPEVAGLLPALVGSIYLMGLTAAIAIPLGVGAAIYLEEYASHGRITSLIEINISNLAGVPSIIYGLLGLELFVRALALKRRLDRKS